MRLHTNFNCLTTAGPSAANPRRNAARVRRRPTHNTRPKAVDQVYGGHVVRQGVMVKVPE